MRSYKCCTNPSDKYNKIISLSSLLKLIAEENRLKILCILTDNEHCVCEIETHTNMSQSLISHHLADMKDAKLVVCKKSGLRVYYKITKKGTKIFNLLKEV